ncbi:MAG TPA: NYN domain-containing protein [Pseudonocardia sp.]
MSAPNAEPTGDAKGVSGGVDWSALPEPLRARLAEVAAGAVGDMPSADVPPALRRIAGFTPAKRAKLGGATLVAELTRSSAFRAAVVAWWDEHRPGELSTDDPSDPLTAASAAVLTGAETAAAAVAATAKRAEVSEITAERDTLLSKVDKLTAEMERLRGELTEARAQTREAGQQREAEFLQLRRRISEQGATLRAALDARSTAEAQMAALRAETAKRLAAADATCEREHRRAETERQRAERAAMEVAAARQAAREARQADETRLALLVDTLGGAVAGLRRELALGGGGPRPADLVVGARASQSGTKIDSVTGLDALLAVPTLHLVVDGYNVSKTGYPELPLADQRNRLITQLGALAARTRVEITVVFDGAGVMAAPPRGARGVRVLFSDPGVLADDVIRSIVAAEPHGRPVAVATSDRAVVTSVRASGAYSVPSTVLVTRLARP